MAFGRLRRRVARPGGLAALVVVLALVASGCFSPGGSAVQRDGGGNPTSRDASAWPFASTSPWNHPIGRARSTAPREMLRPRRSPRRPPRSTRRSGRSPSWPPPSPIRSGPGFGWKRRSIHVPDSATPAGPPGGDRTSTSSTRPARGRRELEHQSGLRREPGLGLPYPARFPRGRSDRRDRSGMSSTGGVIRTWELQARRHPALLSICLPPDYMAFGTVWPARGQEFLRGRVPRLGAHGRAHGDPVVGLDPRTRPVPGEARPSRPPCNATARTSSTRVDGVVRRALGAEPGQFGARRHAQDPGPAPRRDQQLAVQRRWRRKLARSAAPPFYN